MNKILTRFSLVVLAVFALQFTASKASAQNDTIKIPFNGYFYLQPNIGLSQYFGDINPYDLYNKNPRFAFGAAFGYRINPVLGLRAEFLKTKLYSEKTSISGFNHKLKSDLWDLSLNLTANINDMFSDYKPNRKVDYYLVAGAGMTSFKSELDTLSNGHLVKKDDKRNQELIVPLGLGADFRLSQSVKLNLEYLSRLTLNDDKMDFWVGQQKHDWYSYLSLGVQIMLKAKDSDHDGIPDKDDACPTVAGKKELAGCPDKDGDGIADKDDKCPDVAGKKELAGCPDSDGDGVIDSEDLCPTIKGLAKFKGCPDTDGDGVPDNLDKCPDKAGVAENNGCPANPTPNVMIEKIVYFDTDKSIVLAKNIIDLNEIVAFMNEHPDAKISVAGHTDWRESEDYNMHLSERRADYVIAYLKKKGMKPTTNLEKSFFGKTKPVADNHTEEGMALNRRVEIKVTSIK